MSLVANADEDNYKTLVTSSDLNAKDALTAIEHEQQLITLTTDQNSGGSPLNYVEYKARLNSFTIQNWHKMPVELSPLACASKGWRFDKDTTVKCDFCGSRVNVVLPTKSQEFYERKTRDYADKLTSSHNKNCIWIAVTCPDYFLYGEPLDQPSLRDWLLFSSQEISSDEQLVDYFSKGLTTSKVIDANIDPIKAYAEKHQLKLDAVKVSLHGWKAGQIYKDKILRCNICSRRLALTPHKNDSSAPFDLTRHLNWCPWIYPLNGKPTLTEKLLSDIEEEISRKRKRASLEYHTPEGRFKELKELRKFLRKSDSHTQVSSTTSL